MQHCILSVINRFYSGRLFASMKGFIEAYSTFIYMRMHRSIRSSWFMLGINRGCVVIDELKLKPLNYNMNKYTNDNLSNTSVVLFYKKNKLNQNKR